MKASEIITEAPIPDEWDQSQFTNRTDPASFKEMVMYAFRHSKKVAGKGSSRIAYVIPYQGRDTVLKVALSAGKGVMQNSEEIRFFKDSQAVQLGLVVPVIDWDTKNGDQPLWIHTEYAEKISASQLSGFFNGLPMEMLVLYLHRYFYGDRDEAERLKQRFPGSLEGNPMFQKLFRLCAHTDILPMDLGDAGNWGLYQGKPVIVDIGFTPRSLELYRKYKGLQFS